MCFGEQHSISSSLAAAFKTPGQYATGKGTSARILEVLAGVPIHGAMTAAEIGDKLGLPGRQLSKRLKELEDKYKLRIKLNNPADNKLRYYGNAA